MSDEVENEFNDSISISHDDAQTDFGSKHTIRKKKQRPIHYFEEKKKQTKSNLYDLLKRIKN